MQCPNDAQMTIAQIVYENEKAFVADEREVRTKTLKLWRVMNEVSTALCSLADVQEATPNSAYDKVSRRPKSIYLAHSASSAKLDTCTIGAPLSLVALSAAR